MNLSIEKIEKPVAINFILGQTHFIKSVEDIHEALVSTVPGIKFGLAFCEASGKCLVRWSGTDKEMIELAQQALGITGLHAEAAADRALEDVYRDDRRRNDIR